ncbi:BlaI/MecI/CopY family transcriptional regulator [Enterobacter cloacae]|uniref:BlaI/MecI/CopY family transcriptional regulator n=1 Tax=Enterobacter cloacae TaxID=550 RepID=UPI003314A5A7
MVTLREYIRKQTGNFSAEEILCGFKKYKPTMKLDSVHCQLNRLVERGELEKEKKGRRVRFKPKNDTSRHVFEQLLKKCRGRTNP